MVCLCLQCEIIIPVHHSVSTIFHPANCLNPKMCLMGVQVRIGVNIGVWH